MLKYSNLTISTIKIKKKIFNKIIFSQTSTVFKTFYSHIRKLMQREIKR